MNPRPALAILAPLLATAALGTPSRAVAQLPSLTAPRGALRIELRGAFEPTSNVWIDGTKRPLDALISPTGVLDATTTPLVGEVGARLSSILGTNVQGGVLGNITTVAEWQRGTGTIGLALGITPRITVYGNIPIVSRRTQLAFTPDVAGATLGINPADPSIGTSGGVAQTASFFAAYDAALAELSTRIANGDYANDPARLTLAQQTLAQSPALRDQLFVLLADPDLSSPLLPTAASDAGLALLQRVASERSVFADQLGIAFDGTPALPGSGITGDEFDALLAAPTAYGFSRPNTAPRVSLGDVEFGLVVAAMQRATATGRFAVWGRAGVRLPTGEAPATTGLLDQGGGDHQLDVEVAGVMEVASRRIGLRGEVAYTRQLAGAVQTRIGSPLTALLPARFLAAVDRDPGDIVSVSVQPYFQLATHLAITAFGQYVRRGADVSTYVEGQVPIAGADIAELARNTAATAVRAGAGLSYVHDGVGRDGIAKMPVEASLSIERTITSSKGIVPSPLTSRVMFRVYKKLW